MECLVNRNSSKTIPDLLRMWAPTGAPNDPRGINGPNGYAQRVQRMTGLDLNRQIFTFSDADRNLLLRAIQTVEGTEYRQGNSEKPGEWDTGSLSITGVPC
jgi:hypothetical protein